MGSFAAGVPPHVCGTSADEPQNKLTQRSFVSQFEKVTHMWGLHRCTLNNDAGKLRTVRYAYYDVTIQT